MGSAQYIRDEDGKLLPKLEEIRGRWRRYFVSLFNTNSAALDNNHRGLSSKLVALSLEDPPDVDEMKQALRSRTNGKPMGLDEQPAELRKPGLSDSSHKILLAFHGIIVSV